MIEPREDHERATTSSLLPAPEGVAMYLSMRYRIFRGLIDRVKPP